MSCWKAACGLSLNDTALDPSLLTFCRRRLERSGDPNGLFTKAKEVGLDPSSLLGSRGILTGEQLLLGSEQPGVLGGRIGRHGVRSRFAGAGFAAAARLAPASPLAATAASIRPSQPLLTGAPHRIGGIRPGGARASGGCSIRRRHRVRQTLYFSASRG
ncbi:hypothetical protein [Kitasatospora aureofaciens]|uniref:hypothetical protein n=1 Tax=Kitasatospora aureofaciens TaxID=1894 RepID=UPI001F40AF9D|nr:hypothetical protein [Kitasatospora aureofaciens]